MLARGGVENALALSVAWPRTLACHPRAERRARDAKGWQAAGGLHSLLLMQLAGPFHLPTEADTAALAVRLAGRLGPGDAILLSGPVGAGKSAFARALIRARLGDPEAEVPSPTFTLVQIYGEGAQALWHADLYRLSHPDEVAELGLLMAMEEAICLIEWPDRLGPFTPASALHLVLASEGKGRQATFSGPAAWQPRLADLHG